MPKAGSLVADGLATALMRLPKCRLIERQQLVRLLKEMDLSMSNVVAPDNLKKFGRVANVDAVVVGTVMSYGGWLSANGNGSYLNFNVRLVDTQNAEVLWSASCSLSIPFAELGQVLNIACDEMVTKLGKELCAGQ